MMFISNEHCLLCSQKVCQKYIFQQSGDPNFKNFPLSVLLTQQTLKKLKLWEKTAVEKKRLVLTPYISCSLLIFSSLLSRYRSNPRLNADI